MNIQKLQNPIRVYKINNSEYQCYTDIDIQYLYDIVNNSINFIFYSIYNKLLCYSTLSNFDIKSFDMILNTQSRLIYIECWYTINESFDILFHIKYGLISNPNIYVYLDVSLDNINDTIDILFNNILRYLNIIQLCNTTNKRSYYDYYIDDNIIIPNKK